jgi:hypothetical protein
MPTDPGNKHVSFIKELPQFVAYHQTQEWYLEFQSMPQISREGLYLIQHNPTALKSRANPTCFLAVMELDRESIQRLCQFVIQPYAAEQQVLVSGNGRLLLQFVETYTLACPNETRIHQGCQICVVEIPCFCKLIAGNNQYFAKIAHCNSQLVVQHKVQHAININFLQQYFNTSELVPDNQELLSYIPNILLPNLTFEQYELTQSLGLLSTSLFNMSRLAQASLNDSKIFLDLGAVIEANFQKIDLDLNKFSMKTVEMILTFVNPVIVILTFIGFIRLHFRFQALSVAVGLIRPARANVLRLQDRLWAPDLWKTPRAIVDQPQNVYTLPPLKALDLETLPVSALILGILVLILFLKVFRRITPLMAACCKRIGTTIVTAQSNDTFKISISVGNEEKYISLVLMELPFAAQEYKFQARRFLSGLRVNGLLRPVLQITWPQLTITHKFAPLTYSMVKAISLSHMQAYHLRKILKKPHYVLFHLSREKGNGLILPLEGTAWFSNTQPSEQPHSSRQILQPPPLYPALTEVSQL